MKALNKNRTISLKRVMLSWRSAALAVLGLAILIPSATSQSPGVSSEDDWVGTLPNTHAGPQAAERSPVGQGASAFYVEGSLREVLSAAMEAGGSYVSVEGLPNGELRAIFHGDQFLCFDLELFHQAGLRCGMRTESGSGLIALQVGSRILRSQPLVGDLSIPIRRLDQVGVLEEGVVLHAYDPIGGRSRTSMRAIGGRLYLFQTN